MKFSKAQADKLSALLNLEQYPDCLNFQECHGFLCALACGPVDLSIEEKLAHIVFDQAELDKNNSINSEILHYLTDLDKAIQQALFLSETLLLPVDLNLKDGQIDSSFEHWLLGFFEAHFLYENDWYSADEERTSEMLLPFIAGFDEIENEELNSIRKNHTLLQNLIFTIPQALQDLYLFYTLGEPKPDDDTDD